MRSIVLWCRSVSRSRAAIAVAAGCAAVALVIPGRLGVDPAAAATTPVGLDVSGHQNSITWSTVVSNGAQFAYIKATEGTTFVNSDFAAQYDGAYGAKLIRGAYHFALPNVSSGAAQASFFAHNGGGWSADGLTLPGALDIEYNPYGAECYGLSQSAMVSWIASFIATYQALTSAWPVIYTTYAWWAKCTGNYGGFAGQDPLWIANYASALPALPAGWSFFTFWQYSDSGTFPGDQDMFNGSGSDLQTLATNG